MTEPIQDIPESLYTADDVRRRLKAVCADFGGQRHFAQAHGLQPSALSEILKGVRPLPDAVLSLIGFKSIVLYYVAGD